MTYRYTSIAICIALVSLSAAAATIRITVDRGPYSGPVEVKLGIAEEGHEAHWIGARTIAEKGRRATFENIAAGAYTILASGTEPLQRLSAKAVVGASDVRTVALEIPARTIDGRITIGGKSVGDVLVNFRSQEWEWATDIQADADGRIRGPLWESGAFDLAIRGGSLPSQVRRSARLAAAPVAKLAIDLPDRRIIGRVRDDRGTAVRGTVVVLRATQPEKITTIRTKTDKDGIYEFAGLESGPYTLDVVPDRYLVPATAELELKDAEARVTRDFTVSAGALREVQVVDTKGEAVGGATVACTTADRLRSFTRTDEHGRALVATPIDEPSLVWISPLGGSFAVTRFGRAADDDRVDAAKIIVPSASASLAVETLDTAGGAISNVSLLMRYNGTLVPPSIARFLVQQQIQLSTGTDGRALLAHIPPGVYEFWPYSTSEEAEQLVASAALAAPINVNVVTGENRVTVRFQKLN